MNKHTHGNNRSLWLTDPRTTEDHQRREAASRQSDAAESNHKKQTIDPKWMNKHAHGNNRPLWLTDPRTTEDHQRCGAASRQSDAAESNHKKQTIDPKWMNKHAHGNNRPLWLTDPRTTEDHQRCGAASRQSDAAESNHKQTTYTYQSHEHASNVVSQPWRHNISSWQACSVSKHHRASSPHARRFAPLSFFPFSLFLPPSSCSSSAEKRNRPKAT